MFSESSRNKRFLTKRCLICSYIQKITESHKKTLKIILHNTKHAKHTQIHFQQSFCFFQKYTSVGLPGPLRTAFELNNWFACVKKYTRCEYTNVTCSNLLKRPKTSKPFFWIFQIFICCIIVYMLWPHSLTSYIHKYIYIYIYKNKNIYRYIYIYIYNEYIHIYINIYSLYH